MFYSKQLKKRYRIVLGYTGILLIGISVSLLLPMLLLPFYPDEINLIPSFIVPAFISFVIGFFLRRMLRKKEEHSLTIQEGGVIVVLSWVFAMIVSSIPFVLSGQLNILQGLFESVSGWTTTGLSVVDVTKTPKLMLMWRSLMQFIGGAGLAVIMLSAIIGPGGLGLYNAEGRSDRLLPNVTKSTKLIMRIYLAYALAGTILYTIAGMPLFDSVNHAFAALSTGGFSTVTNSIGEYKSLPIELITLILMVLGTTNFAAHYLLLRGKVKQFFKIGEIRFMFTSMIFFIPVISYFALNKVYENIGESLRVGVFQVVSAVTTTGFSTVGYENWNSMAISIIILLMIIGGGAGSTAGGMKQYRVYILIKSTVWEIKRFFLPRNIVKEDFVYKPEGRYYVDSVHVSRISNFAFSYMIIYAIGVIIFTFYGLTLQDAMFEFASTLGTVGLSVGVTAPNLPPMILITQIFGMLLGRLEIFVVFYAVIKIIKDIKDIIKK